MLVQLIRLGKIPPILLTFDIIHWLMPFYPPFHSLSYLDLSIRFTLFLNLLLLRTFTNPRSTAMNYSRPRGSTGIHVRSPPRSRPSNMIDYSKISNIAPPWNSWESLGITITGVPEKATTFTLWKAFKGCGSVDFIEIFLDRRGAQAGKARLRFK